MRRSVIINIIQVYGFGNCSAIRPGRTSKTISKQDVLIRNYCSRSLQNEVT